MKKTNVALWILQGYLALFFALASGAPKLLLAPEALPLPIPLAAPFIKFIGVCEGLGALGLILPGGLRIRVGVTTLAAMMLTLATVCATPYQLMGGHAGK